MPRTKAEEGTARVTAPASKKRKASALDDSKAAAEIDARQSHSGRKSARLGAVDVNSPGGSATAKKSKYFAPGSSESDSDADVDADAEEVESGYEDEDASMTEQSEGSEPEDEYESSGSDRKPHRRARRGTLNAGRRTSPLLVNKADLWREGVKTGLGPGTQVIIQKPKPRGDGGIRYVPGKIHPNTMEFLRDLRKNNDREWLKAHDPDFRQSWKDFENFLEILTEAIIEIDDTIPELPPKDVVFRIYRDIRFSRDPTPYKPHFSAAFSRTGRKGPYACYYLHLQPGGKCFVGSGLWHPDAEPLRLLRAAIDSHPERMTSVLLDTSIRQLIFGGVGEDEKKVVKALCAHNAENALKTKPKGFDSGHANIDLLKLRNFTMGAKISDADMIGEHGLDKIVELVKAMKPWVTYLNSVVMPDEDDEHNGVAVGGDNNNQGGSSSGNHSATDDLQGE